MAMASTSPLDWRDWRMGAESEYLELLALFMEASKSDLDELRSAMEKGDTDRAESAIHSLKGAAGNLRLYRIEEISKAVEMEIRAGRLNAIAGSVDAFLRQFAAVLARSAGICFQSALPGVSRRVKPR